MIVDEIIIEVQYIVDYTVQVVIFRQLGPPGPEQEEKGVMKKLFGR